jgi:hypothetical protein
MAAGNPPIWVTFAALIAVEYLVKRVHFLEREQTDAEVLPLILRHILKSLN